MLKFSYSYLCDMYRLLYFLAFFGYLNIICYEVKYCNLLQPQPIASSDTLLEVVLDDILNLDQSDEKEKLPEFMFDDYRILVSALFFLPVILYFSWLLRRIYHLNDRISHVVYYFKRLIFPGYYTFLYRYRPF